MIPLSHIHRMCSKSPRMFYRIILAVVLLCFLDGYTKPSLSQGMPDKKEQKRAHWDSVRTYKQSLSPVERKMQHFLRIIKKMKDEKAGEGSNNVGENPGLE